MLMKPRRWLAYDIELNDLLPEHEEIVDRFQHSEIPLDGCFGSNTEVGLRVPGLVIGIGPAVEPARLAEVLALLNGLGQMFLCMDDSAAHSKVIAIGSLNLGKKPVVAITDELLTAISDPSATTASLLETIEASPQVQVMGPSKTRRDGN